MKIPLYLFCVSYLSFLSFHACVFFSLSVLTLITTKLQKLLTTHQVVIFLALRTLLLAFPFALLDRSVSSLCFSCVIASLIELLFPFLWARSKQATFQLVFSWPIPRLSVSFSPSLFAIFLINLKTIILLPATVEVPFLFLDWANAIDSLLQFIAFMPLLSRFPSRLYHTSQGKTWYRTFFLLQ